MRTLKMYCLSNFQVFNTVVLTIVTMMYISSCDLLYNKVIPFILHHHSPNHALNFETGKLFLTLIGGF